MTITVHIELGGEQQLFIVDTPCTASPAVVQDWLSNGWDTAYTVIKGDAFWMLSAIDPDGEIEYCVPYRGYYSNRKPPRWIREVFDV